MTITVTCDPAARMRHVARVRARAAAVDELPAVAGKCPVHELMTQATTEVVPGFAPDGV